MNHKYTSIDRIFSKLIRDRTSEFNETDVIEWCGEALEFIGAVKLYEEAVAFVEVKNHQCQLPAGTHAIIQIGRDNCWNGPNDNSLCPAAIISSLDTNTEPEASVPVALDCNGQPVNEYEVAYYRPYFDLKYEYYLWSSSSVYRERYTPVRLATHTLFNSLVCSTDEDYTSSQDEYTIIRGQYLRFSFREGSVAIAHLRQVVDPETGFPMIPDNISYTTAIIHYITLKMAEKDFYNNREGASQRLKKAEADWQWYCKQASNASMMPYGVDEHQNMLEQRSYLLPRQNRYYGFFGKMNTPENRVYNDPDYRNTNRLYFRGN